MKHKNHYYYLPKEKAKIILNRNGIKLPIFTELDVFVSREYEFGQYNTYLDCRDSWGMGIEIWIEKRKWCCLGSLNDPDYNWEPLSYEDLI